MLAAIEFCSAAAQARRFRSLPAEEWDAKCLTDARLAALAVRHCRSQVASLEVRETKALVPASVVDEVAALKRRALKVIGYWVEDEEVSEDLADIARGTGYADATEDLERIAKLLEDHGAAIQDRRFDAAKVALRARELADLISGASRATATAEWQRELRRALTLMLSAYDDVHAAAHFLFRKEQLKAARVPSVFAATRRGGRAKKKGAVAEPEVAVG